MAVFIQMPKLGLTMTEGTVIRWMKREGDTIEEGQELLEIETDKTNNIELAKTSGTLLKIMCQEGETVPILTKIAMIGQPGEAVPEDDPQAKPTQKDDEPVTFARPVLAAKEAPPPATGRVMASPLAKKLAKELGVDLAPVAASLGNRRIDRDAVQRFADARQASPAAMPSLNGLSGMRKAIAAALTLSKSTVPHFYLDIEVNMEGVVACRAKYNEKAEQFGGPKLAMDFILAKAVALALQDHPKVNRILENDAIRQFGTANVAVAVALDEGILAPVVRDVGIMKLADVAKAYGQLIDKARAGTLQTSDCTDGVLTISNLGKYEVTGFTAILNPPQSTILAVGRTMDRVIAKNSGIHIAPMMTIAASFDHRIIDGAVGAAFMTDLKRILEKPEQHIPELRV